MRGEAEKANSVQCGDKKALEDFINMYKQLWVGMKKREPDSSQ